MGTEEIKEVIEKYLSGTASPEERLELEAWYENIDTNPAETPAAQIEAYKQDAKRFLSEYILNPKPAAYSDEPHYHKNLFVYRWLTAAILLICIGGGVYFYKTTAPTAHLAAVKPLKNDVLPGGNKATLTLSNGKKVLLNDAKNGVIAKQNDIIVDKTSDGKLVYNSDNSNDAGATVLYNTMSTPRGGNYFLTLEDGTKVWLNAASSLKFPVAFKGNERVVELTGEAYFEVAKNKTMPFKVISAGQTVKVIGTHFNVNSYNNEPAIKTTLLEGSVIISAGANSEQLMPGQQSSYYRSVNKPISVANDVNTDEVIAWKNGRFNFDGADIKTVMRQLERWYNVDAEFTNKIPTDHFHGNIPRNVNLSQVLKVLELSGVNFKIEGDKIIIR